MYKVVIGIDKVMLTTDNYTEATDWLLEHGEGSVICGDEEYTYAELILDK